MLAFGSAGTCCRGAYAKSTKFEGEKCSLGYRKAIILFV